MHMHAYKLMCVHVYVRALVGVCLCAGICAHIHKRVRLAEGHDFELEEWGLDRPSACSGRGPELAGRAGARAVPAGGSRDVSPDRDT